MGDIILNEFVTTMKSEEILEKEKEYMEYLKDHISNVNIAFNKYFIPLLDNNDLVLSTISLEDLKEAIKNKANTIQDHDATKYEDIEFYGYRKHYYPTNTEKSFGDDYLHECELYYQESWKHHYQNNSHHQEYWLDSETNLPKDMSYEAIIEMLCDWIAMGMHFHTNTLEWYEKRATEEKSNMTENTKNIVEELLYNVIYK